MKKCWMDIPKCQQSFQNAKKKKTRVSIHDIFDSICSKKKKKNLVLGAQIKIRVIDIYYDIKKHISVQ